MSDQAHALASVCLVHRIHASFASEPILSWVRDGVTPEALQEAIKVAKGVTKAADLTPFISTKVEAKADPQPEPPVEPHIEPARPTLGLRIDRDIPIPTKRTGRQLSPHAVLADQMQVGDSILCETRGQFDTVRKRLWFNGKKSRSVRVESKWRIWRVE
jgi:hypothetical protein